MRGCKDLDYEDRGGRIEKKKKKVHGGGEKVMIRLKSARPRAESIKQLVLLSKKKKKT